MLKGKYQMYVNLEADPKCWPVNFDPHAWYSSGEEYQLNEILGFVRHVLKTGHSMILPKGATFSIHRLPSSIAARFGVGNRQNILNKNTQVSDREMNNTSKTNIDSHEYLGASISDHIRFNQPKDTDEKALIPFTLCLHDLSSSKCRGRRRYFELSPSNNALRVFSITARRRVKNGVQSTAYLECT